jgi:Carboxypeptidase regulatory-like domain/TonB dependent receptor
LFVTDLIVVSGEMLIQNKYLKWSQSMNKIKQLFFCGLLALMSSLCANTMAQHIRGALEGTITDPNSAALSGARVIVKSNATGAEVTTTSNDRGYFNVQNLEAGIYTVTVQQSGFNKYVAKDVNVKVGAVTPLTVTLQVGAQEQIVEVTATSTEAAVDTTRSTVDGVITAKTIENLPLNGRNFLDLAQLEPGVQVRDGGDFDPTKNQMVGVSVGGRMGRSTRIQVDGVDITDENVGTTTTNISNESIQEFQVSRSSLDPSTDLTSSGAINIVTRAGSNQFHGSGFSYFRNESYAADLRLGPAPGTEKPSFERQNFGGGLGGYIIKDRLFWHLEGERARQNGQQFTNVPNFDGFTANFPVPLRETNVGGRLDFNVTQNLRTFYRFNHNDNTGVTGFGLTDLAAFANANFTNWHVVGADYNTARWTHSLRYSYLNFNNAIVDANSQAGTPTTLDPAGNPILLEITTGQLIVGPDLVAPQTTFQDNQQVKYDASVTTGNHTFRFGTSYNHIVANGFASFIGNAPRIRSAFNDASVAAAAAAGGARDPLNFPLTSIRLGNGLGFASEKAAHNLPFGGFFNDRIGLYAQDSWKIKRNFTLNLGLRYVFDSNIANNDLARTPKLAEFSQDLAGKIDRPADLFAPQAGFAWDIFSDGKTVIRGGAGIFYDSNIINNALFDRTLSLPPGLGNDTPTLSVVTPILTNPATGGCLFDVTQYNSASGNCSGGVNLLGQPLKNVIAAAQNIQAVYQQVSAGLAANYPPAGVPPLFDQTLDTGGSLIYNKYKRPYGIMFNIGVQREIKPGLVLSVDYVRNRGVRFGQRINLNRNGAADTLNVAAAQAAINQTANTFRAGGATPCSGLTGSAAIACVISNGGSIMAFANNGLDAGNGIDGGAFEGNNPNFRTIGVIAPVGLSLYNALTASLRGRLGSYGPLRGTTLTVSYSLSRFEATGGDSEAGFLVPSVFNDAPTKFFGPSGLDRTHQLTISFLTDLPWGFKINSTTRFATALPSSIFLSPVTSNGVGEIFFTDLDGDGLTGDPLPGSKRGSFGRDVNVAKLNQLITNFNNTAATGLTPAAQALIDAGLFTREQLIQLGATINNGNAVDLAPSNQVGMDSFINTDIRISKTFGFKERLRIEPMVEIFNLFNVANFDSPGNPLTNVLDGSVGSINGTTQLNRNNRYGLGSGSFAPGIPRAFQFGIRVGF